MRYYNQKRGNFKTKLATATTTVAATSCLVHTSAFAAVDPASALQKGAGIKSVDIDGSGTDSLFDSLQQVVYLVMAVGGFWGILWIVIGGMMLAGSNSNPQKRSGGIAALCVAAIGLFVIYKSYDIAGWAVNLGN